MRCHNLSKSQRARKASQLEVALNLMAALEGRTNQVGNVEITLCFDFDNTVIPTNSDTAIPRTCDGGAHAADFDARLNTFARGDCWTKFMDDSLAAMAAKGATVEAIGTAAREISIDAGFALTARRRRIVCTTPRAHVRLDPLIYFHLFR